MTHATHEALADSDSGIQRGYAKAPRVPIVSVPVPAPTAAVVQLLLSIGFATADEADAIVRLAPEFECAGCCCYC